MRYTGDNVSGTGRAGRIARAIAACALALGLAAVHAAPPAGTLIPNQANAIARVGAATQSASSNTVAATVGNGPPPPPPPPADELRRHARPERRRERRPGRHRLPAPRAHQHRRRGRHLHAVDRRCGHAISAGRRSRSSPMPTATASPTARRPSRLPSSLAPGQALPLRRAPRRAGRRARRARVGAANVNAASTGGAKIAANRDTVEVLAFGTTDCGAVEKTLSRSSGPSPGRPAHRHAFVPVVRHAPRSKLVMTDYLPAGMKYVPGSGRWIGTGATPLTDGVVGDDRQGTGSAQVAYDFDVSAHGAVTATVFAIPAQTGGYVKFDVAIDSGLAIGAVGLQHRGLRLLRLERRVPRPAIHQQRRLHGHRHRRPHAHRRAPPDRQAGHRRRRSPTCSPTAAARWRRSTSPSAPARSPPAPRSRSTRRTARRRSPTPTATASSTAARSPPARASPSW